MSAPGLIRIGRISCEGKFKPLPKMPKNPVIWQGKWRMGEIQLQFRGAQSKYLHLSLFSRLYYTSEDQVKSVRD